MFSSTVYLKILSNKVVARHLESGKAIELKSELPFTTRRLLVGNFESGQRLINRAVKEVTAAGFFRPQPRILVHPLEMVEDGLSQVEERIFLELAAGAGARKAQIHIGRELSDEAVRSMLAQR